MTITNPQSGTNVHEISEGIYRINTPVAFEGELRRWAAEYSPYIGSWFGGVYV